MTSIESLIQVVNKLQDTFASLGQDCPIDLPQIAVVGEQSAGKSSVLENFVGKDFLPRGMGIVTRRPLVLQLINQPGEEFLHTKDTKFYDFNKVRQEIEDETNRMTGTNKGISSFPINLRVYSPHVLNLTIVDLPGLTKVAVGDQPPDIEQQILSMLMQYISKPNCLILAVTPAIIDLANSVALKLARDVDPEGDLKTYVGNRTIGVITKIDMMDQGTDCREVLENRVIPLKRGYVGIVNRGQKDIQERKNIKAAQEAEMEYFKNHPVYKHMIDRLGSHYLQRSLNMQLSQHIKDTLPSLKSRIQEQIASIETELGPLLHKITDDSTERAKILLTLVQEFAKQVDIVLGYQQEFVDTKELSGGSVINRILYQRLPYNLSTCRPADSQMRKQIKTAIINSRGLGGSIFTPDVAFTSVTKLHIANTRDCCERVAESVGNEVLKIIDDASAQKFAEYPNLQREIVGYCQKLLTSTISAAKHYINFYLDAEHAHINTNNPDFMINDDDSKSALDGGLKSADKAHENKVFKKGYMIVGSSGFLKSSRTDYFILKGSVLTSYKDVRAVEPKVQILLERCQIKDYQTGYTNKKTNFQIYNKDKKAIGKDITSLDLSCKSEEDAEDWKASFMAAGVSIDKNQVEPTMADDSEGILGESDATSLKEVEFIFSLVDKYLKIVNKNQIDIIAKICVTCIIHEVRKQILTDTVASILSNNSMEDLMKENEAIVAKRREMQNVYKSCREALAIIHEVMNKMGADASAQKYPALYKNMKNNFDDDRLNIATPPVKLSAGRRPQRPPPSQS